MGLAIFLQGLGALFVLTPLRWNLAGLILAFLGAYCSAASGLSGSAARPEPRPHAARAATLQIRYGAGMIALAVLTVLAGSGQVLDARLAMGLSAAVPLGAGLWLRGYACGADQILPPSAGRGAVDAVRAMDAAGRHGIGARGAFRASRRFGRFGWRLCGCGH